MVVRENGVAALAIVGATAAGENGDLFTKKQHVCTFFRTIKKVNIKSPCMIGHSGIRMLWLVSLKHDLVW